MSVAIVIAAIIAAGTSVVAGAMNARSQREANETNLALGEQARQDTLEQGMISQKNTEKAIALSTRQQALNEKEAKLAREERKEQTTYDRLQNAAGIYTKILNEQTALNARPLAALGKG